MEAKDRNTVFWIERRGSRQRRARRGPGTDAVGSTTSSCRPRRSLCRDILRNTLFEHLESAVLTSATLAVAGGFEYIRNRLGIQNARELVVPSHFDYESQALLYIPPDLPDPRDPRFVEQASQRVRQLLEITRGRAFCLFTSYALMHQLHERLLGELEFPMLLQGTAPKNALLEEFRIDAERGAVRDVVFLARRGRAGRAAELRHHRQAAIRGAERSRGGGARQGHRRRWRQCLLRVPGAERGDLAEAGIRQVDSFAARSRAAVPARQPDFEEAYGRVFLDSLPKYGRTTDVKAVERFFGTEPTSSER